MCKSMDYWIIPVHLWFWWVFGKHRRKSESTQFWSLWTNNQTKSTTYTGEFVIFGAESHAEIHVKQFFWEIFQIVAVQSQILDFIIMVAFDIQCWKCWIIQLKLKKKVQISVLQTYNWHWFWIKKNVGKRMSTDK